jgi:alkanesulfonate monooxygenase SsuD/methylene tetrahydromethanopterin reductase-like flavin-dependent oxidoreductase (luciferase family)
VSSLHVGLGAFGLGRPSDEPAGERLARLAELAESLGYQSLWVAESHFEAAGSLPAPLLVLATMAARTRAIRLGTTSYLLSVRDAIRVAEDVAVLDRLSGGRVILGVGRGFRPALFQAFGIAPREKRDLFEATLERVLAAWRGEPVARAAGGEALRVTPTPLQCPHPPVWVAAFGPKALAQAGRLGLPYLASPLETLPTLCANYAAHRAALPEGAPRADRSVPVIRTVYVADDRGKVERVRAALAEQASALAASPLSPLRRPASAQVDDWALVGDASQVRERIARYREALGLTHLIVRAQVPGADPDEIEASIRRIAALALR